MPFILLTTVFNLQTYIVFGIKDVEKFQRLKAFFCKDNNSKKSYSKHS